MTTNAIQRQPQADYGEAALVMAVGIVVDRIGRLSDGDRQDLYELVKELRNAQTSEDLESIRAAMVEILDQEPLGAQRMDLSEELRRPAKLQNWVDFVSRKLRELRTAAGITQVELAEKSGLPQSHISRLEAGQHSPSHTTLEKLANALGVPLSDLDPSL